MTRGYTTPTLPYTARCTPPPPPPRAAQEWPSGLKGLAGIRVGGRQGRHAALSFSYLRSFWPGTQTRLRRVWGNRWIGSRSRAAQAALDVSDLERLGSGCASSRIR